MDFLQKRHLQTSKQKTIASIITCQGIGVHTGSQISLKFSPAPAHAGISFKRMDLKKTPLIKACWKNVSDAHFCTRISNGKDAFVATIEHVMAAFAACEIDNILVEIDGPEVPIMDGSAAPFIALIEKAGIVEQEASRQWIRVLKPVILEEGNRCVSLTPASRFSIQFKVDFNGRQALKSQNYFFTGSMDDFKNDLSSARTFGFFEDAEKLRAAGLARGASLENAVVIHEGIPMNKEGFRFEDECVRHKVLDAVGDLYLAGYPILADYSAVNSGHEMNHRLLVQLFSDKKAWCFESAQNETYSFEPIPSLALQQPLIPA